MERRRLELLAIKLSLINGMEHLFAKWLYLLEQDFKPESLRRGF
jgi:hypothetical protein